MRQCAAGFRGELHRQLHGQQAEQRGELDDRVEGHRRGVLEGIADRVADDRGVVQRRALLLQLDLDDLLGVVPSGAGVGHEDGLVKAEDGDGDEVADEEEGLDEGEGQGGEEHRDEDVQHALLRVLRADLHDLLAVRDRSPLHPFQPDVGLDELHGAVGAGGHRLGGSAGEPVDHGPAGDQAEDERGVEERELVHAGGEAVRQRHDDRKDHGGGPNDGGADEHRLGRGLEGVARAVVFFQQMLGALEVHVHVEVLLEFSLDSGNLLDQRKLVDGLRVVGHRAVGVHRDGHRAHAQEAEGHQAEGEDRRRDHQAPQSVQAHQIADGHQRNHGQPQVVGREVSGHEPREDAQRRSAFLRGTQHFPDVARIDGGEDLDELRNDRPGERAAGDDRRQLPPLRCVAAQARNDERRDDEGEHDGNAGGDPHQGSERRFEIHLVGVGVAGLGDEAVQEVGRGAGDEHDDAHHKDPHQELHLHRGALHAQQDEGDQGHAGDAVGLEAVGAGTHRIARVVARAVGDYAGVARVVFLDLEDDLHQVGADVRDLGEDAAGDAQRGRAQRFADGEADEARPGVVAGNEQKDEEHHQQLNADEHHADAHARFQRNVVDWVGLAAQAGEGRARVRESVYADAEPGHPEAARDADQAEEQNDAHANGLELQQHPKVQDDDHGDEALQQQQEFALRHQVGLAGFIDQFGDLPHGAVHRQVLQPRVDDQAEEQAEDAEGNAGGQQPVPVHAEELDL